MTVTIYEVASRAGVSISTVSRVLNDRGRVSKETEKKVLAAIKELDFHRNINASGLAFQRTNIIGVLVFGFGDISIPEMYALEFFAGLQEISVREGYSLLVVNNCEDCVKLVKNKRMDGLIVHSSQDCPDLREYLATNGIPVIFVGDQLPDHPELDVYSDYENLFRMGLSHFTGLGADKVCSIIYGNTDVSLNAQLALIADLSAELGLNQGFQKDPFAFIVNGAEDPDTVWTRIGERIQAGFRHFFADSFYLAQQTIDAAVSLKKTVGKDLDVVCVEYEEDQGAWLHPPISGIYLPCREMGVQSMEILINKLNGDRVRSVAIMPRLTVR